MKVKGYNEVTRVIMVSDGEAVNCVRKFLTEELGSKDHEFFRVKSDTNLCMVKFRCDMVAYRELLNRLYTIDQDCFIECERMI